MKNLPPTGPETSVLDYAPPARRSARWRVMTSVKYVVGIVIVLYAIAIVVEWVFPIHRGKPASASLRCASNMRQIANAIMMYADKYRGAYPPDFETLLKDQGVAPGVFVCPVSKDTPAP